MTYLLSTPQPLLPSPGRAGPQVAQDPLPGLGITLRVVGLNQVIVQPVALPFCSDKGHGGLSRFPFLGTYCTTGKCPGQAAYISVGHFWGMPANMVAGHLEANYKKLCKEIISLFLTNAPIGALLLTQKWGRGDLNFHGSRPPS